MYIYMFDFLNLNVNLLHSRCTLSTITEYYVYKHNFEERTCILPPRQFVGALLSNRFQNFINYTSKHSGQASESAAFSHIVHSISSFPRQMKIQFVPHLIHMYPLRKSGTSCWACFCKFWLLNSFANALCFWLLLVIIRYTETLKTDIGKSLYQSLGKTMFK